MLAPAIISCSGSKKILSSTDNTALFLPPEIENSVDMFVDEVDGIKTKFNLADSVQIDVGNHEILVRLEYKPAEGSSIIVGGLGSLLLRAASNKTFTERFNINVESKQEYRFIVKSFDDGFTIVLKNETKNKEQEKYTFKLKDGTITRIF